MDNRFFDIDSNVYLNSIYILSVIFKSDKPLNIDSLLMALHLIKNPSICLSLLDKRNKVSFRKYIQDYELNNIQSEMIKYTSKIYTDGLNEALSFLFSKNLITYEFDSASVYKSSEFDKIDFKMFPKELIYKSCCVNKIMSNYALKDLEAKINNLWKVLK